jgi:protein phosphatase 1 regulatory subunit 7
MSSEKATTPPHISIQNDDEEGHGSPKTNGTPRSSTGWDGKLRIEKEKKAELVNPEAISDPEYSDEEQVLQGQTIEADEGIPRHSVTPVLVAQHRDCGVINTPAN